MKFLLKVMEHVLMIDFSFSIRCCCAIEWKSNGHVLYTSNGSPINQKMMLQIFLDVAMFLQRIGTSNLQCALYRYGEQLKERLMVWLVE